MDYSIDVLHAKLANFYEMLSARYGKPLSHRAGRWGIEGRQIEQLFELGIVVDSSVIPGIDWSSTGILDHTNAPHEAYHIDPVNIFKKADTGLLEVPCTIKSGMRLGGYEKNKYARKILGKLGLGAHWLRAAPNQNAHKLVKISHWASSRVGFVNVMTHSSELMANGSPYWTTGADIDFHFALYRDLFRSRRENDIVPQTLADFARTMSTSEKSRSL